MQFPVLDIPALKKELVIALEDIRDPGNMGTILRIADWFGISHLVCSETCVDIYNPKVVQSSMGSLARVHVYHENLTETLQKFNPVYGTVMQGNNIYNEKLSGKGVILIGNESRGISEGLLKHVSHKITIPNYSSGADSLNAAVACAIVCSEFRRRS
jgi:TrmH family RNA methyltransferase